MLNDFDRSLKNNSNVFEPTCGFYTRQPGVLNAPESGGRIRKQLDGREEEE
jgi:hypothetical protein